MSELVKCSDYDYLESDNPLRGQNYVCLSFISPEEILNKKEVYFFEEFLKNFSEDMNDFFTKLTDKYNNESDLINTIKDRYSYIFNKNKIQDEYKYFINNNGTNLETEFHKNNNFVTSIRGIKVRGVFDSFKEAEIRAQVLKKQDNKFHVYVGQVGCWLPWSPNPDDIQDQEYAETQLNSLMKKYKENQDNKDVFFEERKKASQKTPINEVIDSIEKSVSINQPDIESSTEVIKDDI